MLWDHIHTDCLPGGAWRGYLELGTPPLTGVPTDENTADLFTKVLKRQPFEKHRKVVLNSGAGESTDEVKQQRIAALSAWKTKFKKPPDEEAPVNKVKARLCLRGERTWGETLD